MRMRISTAALKVSPALQGLSTAAARTRPLRTLASAPAADWSANTAEWEVGAGRAPTMIRMPGASPDCALSSLPAKKEAGVLAPARKMLQEKTNEEKMEARLHILHFQGEAYQLPARGHIRQNPQNQRGNLRKNAGTGPVAGIRAHWKPSITAPVVGTYRDRTCDLLIGRRSRIT